MKGALMGPLRPETIEEFIGQKDLRSNLKVFVRRQRRVTTPSIMFCFMARPASEKQRWRRCGTRAGVGFRATSGPVIARAGDLAAILTNLQPYDVLFIDEIHRLSPVVEEILYPAMRLTSWIW